MLNLGKGLLNLGGGLFKNFADGRARKSDRKNRAKILEQKNQLDQDVLDTYGANQEAREAARNIENEAQDLFEGETLSNRDAVFGDIDQALEQEKQRSLEELRDPVSYYKNLLTEFQKSHENDLMRNELRTIMGNEATKQALGGGSGSRDNQADSVIHSIMMENFKNFGEKLKQAKAENVAKLSELGEYLSQRKNQPNVNALNKALRRSNSMAQSLAESDNLANTGRSFKGETLGMSLGNSRQDLGNRLAQNQDLATTLGLGINSVIDTYQDREKQAMEKEDALNDRKLKNAQTSYLLRRFGQGR